MNKVRLVVGPVGVVAVGACLDMTWGNYLSINPRAMSSYGRRASACLSTSDGDSCRWTGWQNAQQLKPQCPALACLQKINDDRYTMKRDDDHDVVVAVAVAARVYAGMDGDTWRGHDGKAIHCVDTTRRPGPVARLLAANDPHPRLRLDPDPRCANPSPSKQPQKPAG